jgi:hypothetical protein
MNSTTVSFPMLFHSMTCVHYLFLLPCHLDFVSVLCLSEHCIHGNGDMVLLRPSRPLDLFSNRVPFIVFWVFGSVFLIQHHKRALRRIVHTTLPDALAFYRKRGAESTSASSKLGSLAMTIYTYLYPQGWDKLQMLHHTLPFSSPEFTN